MNKQGIKEKSIAFLQLTKPLVTLSVALTALTGFILSQGFFAEGWFRVTLGVFLLSAGSATINHLQEARLDSLMDRTRQRPIPSGRLSRTEAAIFSALLVAGGSAILASLNTLTPLVLGLITLLRNNQINPRLKQNTD